MASFVVRHWPLILSAAFAGAVLVYVVATLGHASLWLDELMSLYYSEPAHAASHELWSRMTTDLHPPGYYLLLYVWRELWGSSEFAVRLLSTVLMTIVGIVYLWHVARELGPRVAALSLPLVVVSHVFLVYAQEARSYALLMLLALACAIVYQRACRHERPFMRSLTAVVVLSLLMETLHPYGVLFGGAVCAGLLVYRSAWRERIAVVVAGLLLLVYPLFRASRMVELAAGSFNWFAYLDPLTEVLLGLSQPLVVQEDLLPVALLLLLAVWWMKSRQVDWHRFAAALPLLLLVGVFTGSALLVHLVVEPSLSNRNLAVAAPVIWLLAAHALAALRPSVLNLSLATAWVVLLTANHVLRLTWLAEGSKAEWRASAAFVDGYAAACAGSAIPAFAYVDAARDAYFYGHYLRNDVELLFIDRSDLGRALARSPGDSCPIKFWAPHGLGPDAVATPAQLRELGYELVEFPHARRWSKGMLAGAFVIRARER